MEIETKTKEKKEKKDRWWIVDVLDFFELFFFLPRLVLRFFRDW